LAGRESGAGGVAAGSAATGSAGGSEAEESVIGLKSKRP
jgi:hypothetical protein